MWNIKSEHKLESVYIRDKAGLEIMLSGTMTFYFPKNPVTMDFAAELALVDQNGLKAKLFTVFVVQILIDISDYRITRLLLRQ